MSDKKEIPEGTGMLVGFGCAAVLLELVGRCFWFFLLYQVLVRVEASGAMWAAYWCYVPVSILVGLIGQGMKALSKRMREA